MRGRWLALWGAGIILAIGIASCTLPTSPQVEAWQYEEAKKNCVSCFGTYDNRCREPNVRIYVGMDIHEICPPR